MGTQAVIVLLDVCRLSTADARRVTAFAIRVLIREALLGAG